MKESGHPRRNGYVTVWQGGCFVLYILSWDWLCGVPHSNHVFRPPDITARSPAIESYRPAPVDFYIWRGLIHEWWVDYKTQMRYWILTVLMHLMVMCLLVYSSIVSMLRLFLFLIFSVVFCLLLFSIRSCFLVFSQLVKWSTQLSQMELMDQEVDLLTTQWVSSNSDIITHNKELVFH